MEVSDFLKEILIKQYGEEFYDKILAGYGSKRPVTLRVNTLKSSVEEVLGILDANKIKYHGVNWSELAYVLSDISEEEIKALDIYQEGKIYLQNLSSQLPPIVLAPKAGESILDMAAAPGGKTTQIAAITQNQAAITACERDKIRAERMQHNLKLLGSSKVYVSVTDAATLDDFFKFDRILLDAPCSGSGTILLSDTHSKAVFNAGNLAKNNKAQERLLKKAFNILKPGHEMIYSTCSILVQENEDMLLRALPKGKYEIVPIDADSFEGLTCLPVKLPGTLCVCPTEEYEGFFVAHIKKK